MKSLPNNTVPIFRAFNPRAPMTIYRRHLPHWRQNGATYFVTFRLTDSIPKHVILKWQEDDRIWLKARGIDGLPFDGTSQALYEALPEDARQDFERRAARRLHVELDQCHGTCLLRNREHRDILDRSLHHFHGTRWWTGDFVVMPNHVHGLFQPAEEFPLQSILGSVKGFVSARLTRMGAPSGRLWQQENYDRLVRGKEELTVWREYIQRNPERARLSSDEYTYYRCEWLDTG